jgi:hypothetical protein
MEIITINKLELASELALERLVKAYNLQSQDELFEFAENGDQQISDRYQDEFNDYYDDYLRVIDSCTLEQNSEGDEDNEDEEYAKSFILEFEYEGYTYRFLMWFTEPDEWTSIETSEGIVFDVHYCEDYNTVVVYLQKDAEGKVYELGSQPIIYSRDIDPDKKGEGEA